MADMEDEDLMDLQDLNEDVDAPDVLNAPALEIPVSAPKTMNPILSSYLSKKGLEDAQGVAAENRLIAGLARAGNTLAHSALGATAKSDDSSFDAMDKAANAPVEEYKLNRATETKTASDLAKAEQAKFMREYLVNKLGQSGEIAKARVAAAADKARDASSEKEKKAQDSANTKAVALLESSRGNPAVAQAERDIYASDKANSLATLYGDPNKLSQQQVKLLVSELGKIASGGTPTMHELDVLSPNTLMGSMSATWSRLSNEPTPANAGAFIKQYQDYARALTRDARKVINDKYGRVIEANRKNIGPENASVLESKYLKRFDEETKEPSEPALTEEDKQAKLWAEKNTGDPRAAKIMSRLAGRK